MRLSKLSNRQIRSLIRNADVRFANGKTNFDNSELIKKAHALDDFVSSLVIIKEECEELAGPVYTLKALNIGNVKKSIPIIQKHGIKVPSSLVDKITKISSCDKLVKDLLNEIKSFGVTLKPLLKDKKFMKVVDQDNLTLDFDIRDLLK